MLRISSFNIQNDYSNYNYNKSLSIYNYLTNNNIDVLGLQEVYSKIDKDLNKLILNKYNYNGKYRFIKLPILNRVNEKNPIITKYNISYNHTYKLPHLPSPLNRIITKNIITYKGYNISIYNTHLDYKFESVKLKQLKYIYKLISKDNNLIILMGDFNLKNNKEIFNTFTKYLEDLGINRIKFNDRTLKRSKYHREIDHIFISGKFKLIDYNIIKDIDISDHYPIIADIDI